MLKALVRCGSCGARFVGDPCHGKFYYWCIARCKRLPTVGEAVLDTAVKEAVAGVMIDPGIIMEPLRKLKAADETARAESKVNALAADSELRRLGAEEGRILDAYQAGILSPMQLGLQLEKIKASPRGA